MSSPHHRVVALGGGHGLAATLRALTAIDSQATAIVTVADDGGSSGRLRQDYGVLPPGDLRMALSALCDANKHGQELAQLFQHRFAGDGSLSGHPVGNVILTALWQLETDKVSALRRAASLLGVRGQVLPMSTQPLEIMAHVEESTGERRCITGQAQVASAEGRILDVAIVPENPPACPEALTAIATADWIILGPGSWYTSIMPALIIPELREAIVASPAQKLIVLNLTDQPGETEGLSPVEHLKVFGQYGQGLKVDAVLVDDSFQDQAVHIRDSAAELGARLILADVQSREDPTTHDSLRLSRVLDQIMARVP